MTSIESGQPSEAEIARTKRLTAAWDVCFDIWDDVLREEPGLTELPYSTGVTMTEKLADEGIPADVAEMIVESTWLGRKLQSKQ